MNYKIEDKELVELSGKYTYYDFTEEKIKQVISKSINEIEPDEWRMLIQMLYPKCMIGSGLFQPILIFKIDKTGKRIEPPVEAYNSLNDLKNGTCLLFRIIDFIEQSSQLKIDSSWYELKQEIIEKGEFNGIRS